MSLKAMQYVQEHSPYRGGMYSLHLALGDTAADPDHELWGRQQYFADKARIDRARANVYLKQMIEDGLLVLVEDHSKSRKPNRYRLVLDYDRPKVFDCGAGWYARNMPSDEDRAAARAEAEASPPLPADSKSCALSAHDETCADPQHVPDGSCALSAHAHVPSAHMHMCAGATHNTSSYSSSYVKENTARGDVSPSAPGQRSPGGERARAHNQKPSETVGQGELLAPEVSAADAAATPPTSAGPPRRRAQHPETGAVVAHLARAVSAHLGKRVRTTTWNKHVDLLLRRGPAEWADPEPIDPGEVRAVIDWLFGPGAVRVRGFSWADQVRSGEALRRHWLKVLQAREVGAHAPVPSGGRRPSSAEMVAEAAEMVQRQIESGEVSMESLWPGLTRRSA